MTEPNLTLDKVIAIGRTRESAQHHSKEIEANGNNSEKFHENVNKISDRSNSRNPYQHRMPFHNRPHAQNRSTFQKKPSETNRVGDVVHQGTSEKNVAEPEIKPVINVERKDILKKCVTAKLQV